MTESQQRRANGWGMQQARTVERESLPRSSVQGDTSGRYHSINPNCSKISLSYLTQCKSSFFCAFPRAYRKCLAHSRCSLKCMDYLNEWMNAWYHTGDAYSCLLCPQMGKRQEYHMLKLHACWALLVLGLMGEKGFGEPSKIPAVMTMTLDSEPTT